MFTLIKLNGALAASGINQRAYPRLLGIEERHHPEIRHKAVIGTTRQRKPRRPTFATALREAKKAGVQIRYEVDPDGKITITIIAGKGEPDTPEDASNDLDNWIAKHASKIERH